MLLLIADDISLAEINTKKETKNDQKIGQIHPQWLIFVYYENMILLKT